MGRTGAAALRRLVREPLVHFLTLGAAIFAVAAFTHAAGPAAGNEIRITAADLARIRTGYAQQWGALPSESEMPSLVDKYVRSEILFREGSELGLADGDSVIRNRIVQKMEFLLQDPSTVLQPTEAEMRAYLSSHAERFGSPERLRAETLYFSDLARSSRAEPDARRALAQLQNGRTPTDEGDPLMLPSLSVSRSEEDIAKAYGSAFAHAVFALQDDRWHGPIRSATGVHLVRVLGRDRSRIQPLDGVRAQIHDAIMSERLATQNVAAYDRLAKRYEVTFEPEAKSAARSKAAR